MGSNTTVRVVATSVFETARRMNLTNLAALLSEPRLARVIAVGCENRAQLRSMVPRRLLARLRLSRVQPVSQCALVNFPSASTGVLALQNLFRVLNCLRVTLFGFVGLNSSQPYHYWRDNSSHDGVSTRDWYTSRFLKGLHNFDAEHELIYHALGHSSWTVTRTVFERTCGWRSGPALCNCATTAQHSCNLSHSIFATFRGSNPFAAATNSSSIA